MPTAQHQHRSAPRSTSSPEKGSTMRKVSCASLDEALTLVKAAGYRVSKPKPKLKDRVGPTFVCTFADGVTTHMSVFTSLENLDWDRGIRLSQAAYQSRWRRRHHIPPTVDISAPILPAIVAAHFEQDGVVLGRYSVPGTAHDEPGYLSDLRSADPAENGVRLPLIEALIYDAVEQQPDISAMEL